MQIKETFKKIKEWLSTRHNYHFTFKEFGFGNFTYDNREYKTPYFSFGFQYWQPEKKRIYLLRFVILTFELNVGIKI